MLNVLFTVDVEIWCDGWTRLDDVFAESFDRYIIGKTQSGDYGVGFQAELLSEHGLKGVFFVEPIFSQRFGRGPLREIVSAIQSAGQDVQLHVHTEWLDELKDPIIPSLSSKVQNIRDLSFDEQRIVIEAARTLLHENGVASVTTFRAGNFGASPETLKCLDALSFSADSSFNGCYLRHWAQMNMSPPYDQPFRVGSLCEYPMTVFQDGRRSMRQAALTATSTSELESLLWQALETGRQSFVILSHGSELLTLSKHKVDKTVLKRFDWLCEFLARNQDSFKTCTFDDLHCFPGTNSQDSLTTSRRLTYLRYLEQLMRVRHR